MAATNFGTTGGNWDVAANWDNGVPTAALSAVIGSSAGICVLPYATSGITKNLSGGGTIGVVGAGVNALRVVSPTANYCPHFVGVQGIENQSAANQRPKGHG